MQSCGVLAYTIPGHKIIHMNAQALRMYGVKNIEEAQSKLGIMLKKVIYPDVDVIEKLKRLHKVDVMVDYECIIGKGESNECHALATTKVVRIPSGERAVITTFLDVSEMVVLKNALQKAEGGKQGKIILFICHVTRSADSDECNYRICRTYGAALGRQ